MSYRDRLIKLRLLPLNSWLEYLDLVFFYKCLNNLVDFTFEFDHYFSFVQGRMRVQILLIALRTLARKFSNIYFFLKLLPLKDDELVISEM